MHFRNDDYEKILHFLSLIQENTSDFRYQVLNCLSSLFSYNHNTFFLVDKDGNLTNPVGFNIGNKFLHLYNQHYYKTDIFHPLNVSLKFIFNTKSYSITDLMSLEKFEKTEYYYDFLKMQNLYYELALPLKHNNQLIGAIGVFRPKEDGDFLRKEIQILNKLSNYIASRLHHHLETSQLKYEKQFNKNIINELPIGLITLDNHFNIMTYNEIAYSYCKDILNNFSHNNPVKPVIDMALTKATFSNTNHSRIYIYLKPYSFEIIPVLLPDKTQGLRTSYYVYIMKSASEDRVVSTILSDSYDLTRREQDIINLLALGLNNQEIADKLYISYNTVRTHLDNIRKKLGVKNRTAILNKLSMLK
ncbi:MAG: LuxR C-terminal-related transcriptional regulator [Peptococcales bacterium]|jgi:DNA-binding CsgD family transcriptional regulator